MVVRDAKKHEDEDRDRIRTADTENGLKTCSESDLHFQDTFGSRVRTLLPAVFSVLVILIVMAFAIIAISYNYFDRGTLYGCDPDQRVWISGAKQTNRLSIWNFSYTLSITMPLRKSMAFSTAKTIDIVWDVVVGRGYQALSAVFVYKIFRVVITDYMKTESVAHDQVIALQYSTTSLWALWVYAKGCRTGKAEHAPDSDRHARGNMAMLMLSASYVLAAPTWLSAMTGYQASMKPFFLWDSNYVPYHKLEPCKYNIVDGHRIGLEDNACVLSGLWADAIKNCTVSLSLCVYCPNTDQ